MSTDVIMVTPTSQSGQRANIQSQYIHVDCYLYSTALGCEDGRLIAINSDLLAFRDAVSAKQERIMQAGAGPSNGSSTEPPSSHATYTIIAHPQDKSCYSHSPPDFPLDNYNQWRDEKIWEGYKLIRDQLAEIVDKKRVDWEEQLSKLMGRAGKLTSTAPTSVGPEQGPSHESRYQRFHNTRKKVFAYNRRPHPQNSNTMINASKPSQSEPIRTIPQWNPNWAYSHVHNQTNQISQLIPNRGHSSIHSGNPLPMVSQSDPVFNGGYHSRAMSNRQLFQNQVVPEVAQPLYQQNKRAAMANNLSPSSEIMPMRHAWHNNGGIRSFHRLRPLDQVIADWSDSRTNNESGNLSESSSGNSPASQGQRMEAGGVGSHRCLEANEHTKTVSKIRTMTRKH